MTRPARTDRVRAITEIVNDLRRIFKAIHEYSRKSLKEFGVTGPQLWALHVLRDGGALGVGELARRMYLHISTVSAVVDRLEARGLVRRQRGERDGRQVDVRLTSKGKALLRRAPEPAQGKLLHGLERLTVREVLHLHEAIGHLVTLMEADRVEATFFFADA